MNINDEMAKLMNFEKKDIVKQVACPEPENHPNCMTYHCEVVGRFYVNHEHRIDVEDWNPEGDLIQAFMCLEKATKGVTSLESVGVPKVWTFTYWNKGRWSAIASSPTLAICKAILKAKGVKV